MFRVLGLRFRAILKRCFFGALTFVLGQGEREQTLAKHLLGSPNPFKSHVSHVCCYLLLAIFNSKAFQRNVCTQFLKQQPRTEKVPFYLIYLMVNKELRINLK